MDVSICVYWFYSQIHRETIMLRKTRGEGGGKSPHSFLSNPSIFESVDGARLLESQVPLGHGDVLRHMLIPQLRSLLHFRLRRCWALKRRKIEHYSWGEAISEKEREEEEGDRCKSRRRGHQWWTARTGWEAMCPWRRWRRRLCRRQCEVSGRYAWEREIP